MKNTSIAAVRKPNAAAIVRIAAIALAAILVWMNACTMAKAENDYIRKVNGMIKNLPYSLGPLQNGGKSGGQRGGQTEKKEDVKWQNFDEVGMRTKLPNEVDEFSVEYIDGITAYLGILPDGGMMGFACTCFEGMGMPVMDEDTLMDMLYTDSYGMDRRVEQLAGMKMFICMINDDAYLAVAVNEAKGMMLVGEGYFYTEDELAMIEDVLTSFERT